jgi:hypothetical protein
VIKEYVANKVNPIIAKIELVEQSQTAIKAELSNIRRAKGGIIDAAIQ